MSHQDDIKAIVTSVGGAANIKSLTHCATRLRFELNDAGKVDNAALDANKLVLGAVPQSGDGKPCGIALDEATAEGDVIRILRGV